MLRELRIDGLGVIDSAAVDLEPGLTVLTGETGAGKTMVVTGLALLFGGRADPGRIRSGAARLSVEGRLELPTDHPAWRIAGEAGARADEDGTLILARTVNSAGRSRAYVGGRSVPVAVLAEVAETVWALHGQRDQLRLHSAAAQRDALDEFAGPKHQKALSAYRSEYATWRRLDDELADKGARTRELAQAAEILRHGLAEITAADPQPGEDTELRALANRLGDSEALQLAARQAHESLSGDPLADSAVEADDVLSRLAQAQAVLERASDEALQGLGKRAQEIGYGVAELAAELAAYAEDTSADPARLGSVQARLAVLQALTRRYADPDAGVDGVLGWAAQAQAQLVDLDVSDDALDRLREQRDHSRTEVGAMAAGLSAARRKAAKKFGAAVVTELADLAMPDARIDVTVRDAGSAPGPHGADEVAILLSAHLGAEPAPLNRTASGGELSRVMLAIEVVLAGSDPVALMVFDEVDAGVGGQAAVQIGRRLAALAAHHQVLVVTHLPQVAAYGQSHLVIDKSRDTADGAITASGITAVRDDGRVAELARMLAGMPDSESGLAHAAELLQTAGHPGRS